MASPRLETVERSLEVTKEIFVNPLKETIRKSLVKPQESAGVSSPNSSVLSLIAVKVDT